MKIKLYYKLITVVLFLIPSLNFGQAPNLGTTSGYALFTAAGAFNNLGATVVTGNIGTNVGAFSGFPPGIVIGQIHLADPASVQAAIDVNVAYNYLFGLSCGLVISTNMGNGQLLTPNIYCLGAASTINGDLILDGLGNPNSLFIFKIDGALSTNVLSRVLLINSASLCNVYWQVNGAVELGDGSVMNGTIIANGALSLLEGSSLLGRGLSRAGAISTHHNVVTIGFPPTASIITSNGATTFCTGNSVILSGNISGTWSNNATTPSITVTAAGDYFVTNSSPCGSITSNHIVITVNPLPAAFAGSNASICSGSNIALGSASIPGHTYSWIPSTGLSSATSAAPVASPLATTTYTLTETISATGCQKSNSITITVNAIPSCLISGNTTICNGQSTQICAPSAAGYTYKWSNNATSRCYYVSSAGTYIVTVTKSGCSSICSKTIIVNPIPSCNISGSSTICLGTTNSLCAPEGYSNYLWSTGSKTNCITISTGGKYSLTVTNANGCSSACSKTIVSYPKPICNVTGNQSPPLGQTIPLTAPSGMASYQWNTGGNTRSILVKTSGTYWVTISNYSGCTSTCSITINFMSCSPKFNMDSVNYSRENFSMENRNLEDHQKTFGIIELNVYPNPFNSKAIMEIQNTESNSHPVIDLYNLSGTKIANLFDQEIRQGVVYSIEINADNLIKGIYIYKMINGNQVMNGKLNLVR